MDSKLLFSKVYTFTNHQVAPIIAYIWLIKLYYQIKENKIEEEYLKDIEAKDNIFKDIDNMIYY